MAQEEPDAAPVKPAAFDMDHVMELAIVVIISAILVAFVWSIFLAAVVNPHHWAFTASFFVSVPCSFIAGGYAGGPEMQGTPVRAFREAVAEAEAADAHERRGVWAEMPREQNMSQAEAAVRAVVKATRNRMPDAIVSRRCVAPRHVAASRRRRAHRLTSSSAVCAQGVRGDHAARI